MIQISEAESRVMQVLWEAAPRSAEEVIAALADAGWAEGTIKTLLNRLLTKGAVSASKDGRRFFYSPLIARDAWVLEESRSLLDRLFDGKVAPLVAHFSQHRKLSADDVAQLRQLIEELDDGQR